jgi:hypothetical protein
VGRAGKGSRLDASTPAKEAGRGRGAPVRNQAGGGLAGGGRLLRVCMLGVDRDPVGASVARREVRRGVDFVFPGSGWICSDRCGGKTMWMVEVGSTDAVK